MYREGLLILAIILLVVGAVVNYFTTGIVADVFYWIAVIGAIAVVIWVVLLVLNTYKSGA